MTESRRMSGPRAEDEVAGWLTAALSDYLASQSMVYLKGQEYGVTVADEDDPDSVFVLERTADGRRFEVEIEVEAIELAPVSTRIGDRR